MDRKTGLPAMAMPLAMGRRLKKYFPIMVRAGFRLKARPKPGDRTEQGVNRGPPTVTLAPA